MPPVPRKRAAAPAGWYGRPVTALPPTPVATPRRPIPDGWIERPHLLVHPAGELHLKSAKTRRRFGTLLTRHLRAALGDAGALVERGGRLHVVAGDLAKAADLASHVFGVHRVSRVEPFRFESLDELADGVGERARDRVRGRTFAVRVRRRGRHDWTSDEANRLVGARLFDVSAGVDLDHPEEEVRVEVWDDRAFLVTEAWPGPSGLPSGAQERSLALLSGGFDSPVAAWMLMRRGSPTDFVHFTLECSASEHALLVAHALHARWGRGTDPLFWKVDFQPVKEALLAHVDSRVRQVVLKELMMAAADRLAGALGVHAIVTGDSVGQVSSQTLSHLAAVDRHATRTVLRPLAAMLKEEIIAWARRIGTEDISARAKEVCDLSTGPVEVSARWSRLDRAHDALPAEVVESLLARVEVIALEDWLPGLPFVPVVGGPPPGVPEVGPHDRVPAEGPIAVSGSGSARLASRLLRQGREVSAILRA